MAKQIHSALDIFKGCRMSKIQYIIWQWLEKINKSVFHTVLHLLYITH